MDTLRRRLLRCITVQNRDAADANRRTDTAGANCFCRVCCVATLRKEERDTQTDTTTAAPRARRRLCCIVPHHEKHANISQNDVAAPMGGPQRWFRAVRRALTQVTQPPCGRSSIAVMDGGPESEVNAYKLSQEIEEPTADGPNEEWGSVVCTEGFSQEEVAAVTIQAYFRAHLARRAYRAMKSLVRLQAMVRGMYVRRQAEVAIHCMQALVRLQVRVRARQLLDKL